MAETEVVTGLASKVEPFRVLECLRVAVSRPENRRHLFTPLDFDTKGVQVALRYADKGNGRRIEAQQFVDGVFGINVSVSEPSELRWMLKPR